MSCQKIVYVPVAKIAPTTVVGLAGAPIMMGAVALAVAGIMAWQLKEANDKLKAERAAALELERIRAEVRRRKEGINKFNAAMADAGIEALALKEAERELEAIRLSDRRRRKRAGTIDEADGGPAQIKGTSEKTRTLLAEVYTVLEAVPPAYRTAERSPFSRFETEWRNLSEAFETGRPPMLEELLDFKRSLVRSITRFQKETEARADSAENYMNEMRNLYHELLTVRHLTDHPSYLEEAEALRRDVSELASRNEMDRAALDVLKKKIGRIREIVETANTWLAYRQTLAETLTRHLGEMGYRTIEAFNPPDSDENEALMAVPDGERLRVAIHSDGRMAFDLMHEGRGAGEELTSDDKAFFRRQEQRWRRDFKELIRRLTADGFSYEVELAKLADERSIPVAVMETAEEMLSEEEERRRMEEAGRRNIRER